MQAQAALIVYGVGGLVALGRGECVVCDIGGPVVWCNMGGPSSVLCWGHTVCNIIKHVYILYIMS